MGSKRELLLAWGKEKRKMFEDLDFHGLNNSYGFHHLELVTKVEYNQQLTCYFQDLPESSTHKKSSL